MVRIKPNKSCLLLRQECKINVNIISMAFDGSKSSFIADSNVNASRGQCYVKSVSKTFKR